MIVRDLNHLSIVDEIASGKVLMGVEPMIARRFYTNLTTSERQKLCGEKTTLEAILVKSCQVIEAVCLLVSLILVPFIVGWWTVLLVPLLLGVGFMEGVVLLWGRCLYGLLLQCLLLV